MCFWIIQLHFYIHFGWTEKQKTVRQKMKWPCFSLVIFKNVVAQKYISRYLLRLNYFKSYTMLKDQKNNSWNCPHFCFHWLSIFLNDKYFIPIKNIYFVRNILFKNDSAKKVVEAPEELQLSELPFCCQLCFSTKSKTQQFNRLSL